MSDHQNIKLEMSKVLKVFIGRVMWMKSVYYIYQALYEQKEDRNLLEEIALSFFSDLNKILKEYLTLEFCKITDPPQSLGGKNSNVTVDYFVEKLKDTGICDNSELKKYQEELKNFTEQLKEARHKRIAHLDYEMNVERGNESLGAFEEGLEKIFLKNLWDFCNYLSEKIDGHIRGEFSPVQRGDVQDLLDILLKAVAFQRLPGSIIEEKHDILYQVNKEMVAK